MKTFKRLFAFMVMVALLAGCGGGGDEGSSTDGLPQQYTGNRSEAAITTSNARAMATSAYDGTVLVGTLNVLGKAAGDDSIEMPSLLEAVEIMENAATSASVEPKTSAKSAEASVSESDRTYGYSGYYDFDFTLDTVSGDTNGAISFVNYRPSSYSGTMNGRFTFSGLFNKQTGNFTRLKMTFPNITLTGGTSSYTISGDVEASNSGSMKILKMTLAVTDNASKLTAAIKDYTLTLTNNSSLTCTGTFYDPIQGYVTVSTPSPLIVSSLSARPTSGQLLVTGSNGTKARLTFSSGGYTVWVDATGNGTFVAAP